MKRHHAFILLALLCVGVVVGAVRGLTITNTDGYINVTSNNTTAVINWNASRTANTSQTGLLDNGSYAAFTAKAATGSCAAGSVVQSTTSSGVTCVSQGTISGHLEIQNTTTPVLASCGTNPVLAGNDAVGTITVGAGLITSCTLTFGSAWTNPPSCMTEDATAVVSLQANANTTTMTITSSVSIGAGKVNYLCTGWR